ncbi:MAG: GFA family protein [Pseudomonadota bacterium]
MSAPDMPSHGTGRCLCKRIRYRWSALPLWAGHCHCDTCRRNCSAPFTSFFAIADGFWAWTGDEPALYQSNPGRYRYFCPTCGTPMAYRSDDQPGEIHFYAASMDDPEQYRAQRSFHRRQRLSWIELPEDSIGKKGK